MFKKRAKSTDGSSEETTVTKSKNATLPNHTKSIIYKPIQSTTATQPAATMPAATSLADHSDRNPHDSALYALVRETGDRAGDLDAGMRRWEKKISQNSVSSKEEDSGYMECGSWNSWALPAHLRKYTARQALTYILWHLL